MFPWMMGILVVLAIGAVYVIRDAQADDKARKRAPKRREQEY